MFSDSILKLIRKDNLYFAGYSIIKNDLQSLKKQFDLLHENEIKQFEMYEFNRRKHSYLLGRISAKIALSHLSPNERASSVCIENGIFDFPIVKSNINYNLSVGIAHCDDIGVSIAFPDVHPMGVDLEKIDPKRTETMKSCVKNDEMALLQQLKLDNEIGYTLIWTIKEALSKILRTGFSLNFQALEIGEIKFLDTIFECTFQNLIQYKAVSYLSGGYILTIVLPAATEVNLSAFWLDFVSKTQ